MNGENQNTWHFGRIKVYNDERGFGFVKDKKDSREHFFHITKVKTPPVAELEDVVFVLKPSTKKPDSYEAVDLIHLEKFHEDLGFLIEIFLQYTYPASIRKEVLKSLKEPQLKFLFKQVIHSYVNQREESWKESIIDVIEGYSIADDLILSDSFFRSVVEEIGSSELTVEVWKQGILALTPTSEEIKAAFLISAQKGRVLILNKIDDSSFKNELIEQLLEQESPESVLKLVRNFLIKENKLGTTDVPAIGANFWDNKKGSEQARVCLDHLQIHHPPAQLLELNLSGLIEAFPKEYVFNNFRELPKEQIAKIVASGFLSNAEKYQLLKSILELNNSIVSNTKEKQKKENGEYYSEYEYWEVTVNSYKFFLNIGKDNLSPGQYKKLRGIIEGIFPEDIEFDLWLNGYTTNVPSAAILKKLLSSNYGFEELSKLITEGKLSEDEALELVNKNLESFSDIGSKSEFKCFHKHISILIKLDHSPAEGLISSANQSFLKASLWLNDEIALSVDDLKPVFLFFEQKDQIKFIRKLFHLEHSNSNVTVPNGHFYDLVNTDRAEFKPLLLPDEILIDYSVNVLIQGMKSLEENGRLLFESELLKLFYKSVSSDNKKSSRAEHFFEECIGRYEDEYNWRTQGRVEKVPFGEGKFYYAISFKPGEERTATNRGGYSYTFFEANPNFEHLKEEVKKIPGRKWNSEKGHWGVPSSKQGVVMEFAKRNRFFIDMEGSNYKNNTHLADFKRGEIPNGITYCEGRLANKTDNKYDKKFWWCNNNPCFQNCKTEHTPEEWNSYTMLDMLKIKKFNLDDVNRSGDKIEDGQYYQFISSINRFNHLLDHLFCRECSQVLYPVEDSHFANYRVTHFHCRNQNCSKHHQDVYLHHCLNGKCNGIIDSRVSGKCPNGLYICSNEACGSCCSTEMFKRRLNNLQTTGGYIHQNLDHAVNHNMGHLERGEYYCYICSDKMMKVGDNEYQCRRCDIVYEIGRNNYIRETI